MFFVGVDHSTGMVVLRDNDWQMIMSPEQTKIIAARMVMFADQCANMKNEVRRAEALKKLSDFADSI